MADGESFAQSMALYEGCRYGSLHCPPDAYIGKALEVYGEYSQVEAEMLRSFLSPGSVVVEAGAHVGTLTVAMAQAVGSEGMVYAYEAQPKIFEALKFNAADLSVKAFNFALSSRKEVLRFDPQAFNTGGVALGADGGSDIQAIPLDAAKIDLRRLDLLKVDVEGMEVEVLTGARKTIERCRPAIYCENDRPVNSRALFDLLFDLGYRVWHHAPPLFNPANHRGQAQNVYPGIVSLNLIAIPEEREAPEQVKGLTEVRPNQWAAVARLGGVGDNLIAAGVLSDLVRQGNHVEMITSQHCGSVFEHNPFIDKLSICHDGDQPGDGGIEWQKWFEKRSHEYDGRLYHLSHTIETTLAFVQAQTAFWWPERVRRHRCHKSYLEMAADVCGTMYQFEPLFYPSRVEKAKALETKAKMGDRVIAWVICGSRFDKVYPYAAMAVARLIKELGVSVMLVGAPGREYEIAKDILANVVKHNGDEKGLFIAGADPALSKDWPIRRSLAQVLACDLVIGPDTGLMWGAAMEKMPKIMLLGHASPENITKYWRNTVTLHADQRRVSCAPCHRLNDTMDTCRFNADKTGTACMSDISVELIVQKAREALGCR